MSFMAGQTTGPIALKFTELQAQKSGLGFKLKKFLKNLINILIILINSQSSARNVQ